MTWIFARDCTQLRYNLAKLPGKRPSCPITWLPDIMATFPEKQINLLDNLKKIPEKQVKVPDNLTKFPEKQVKLPDNLTKFPEK